MLTFGYTPGLREAPVGTEENPLEIDICADPEAAKLANIDCPKKDDSGFLSNLFSSIGKGFISIFQPVRPTLPTAPVPPPQSKAFYEEPTFWIIGGAGVLALFLLTSKPKKKKPDTVLVD